jgi:hypothetical protein
VSKKKGFFVNGTSDLFLLRHMFFCEEKLLSEIFKKSAVVFFLPQ